MSDTDPFADATFLGRLQKLLPMLGSEQPGEADAARRKLIEHLSQHRLSLYDIATRLRDPAPRALFSPSAREISLERQLAIARQAKEDASHENMVAGMRIRSLEAELQQTTFDVANVLQSQAKARVAAIAAWLFAAACLLFAASPVLFRHLLRTAPTAVAVAPQPELTMQREGTDGDTDMHLAPGERRGSAAVQDLAIRLSPNDQAAIRAFLNRGEPVAIQQRVHIGVQTWLLVRSATGIGWVRSGDVLQ